MAKLISIVAVAYHEKSSLWGKSTLWVIGESSTNTMPWPRIKADLAWFKESTMGHTIIMGRRTWESLGCKPLPGRKHLVLTRDPATIATGDVEGVEFLSSVKDVMDRVLSDKDPTHKFFVIGGGQIYKEFITLQDELWLDLISFVDAENPPPLEWKVDSADVFFPVAPVELKWATLVDEKVEHEQQDVFQLRRLKFEHISAPLYQDKYRLGLL